MNEWLIGKIIGYGQPQWHVLVIDTCGVSQTFTDSHYLPSSAMESLGVGHD